jgi:hypothetical protein
MKPTTASNDANFKMHYQPDVSHEIKYGFALCYLEIHYYV